MMMKNTIWSLNDFRLKRKEIIRWVLNHPVWTYPQKRNRKEEGEALRQYLDNDLDYLPEFGWERCISITPMFVNPDTRKVDNDDAKNIHLEIWIEAGPPMPPDENFDFVMSSHDYNLDCGGDTIDDALINLAALVKEHYGDYTKEGRYWLTWHRTSPYGVLYNESKE